MLILQNVFFALRDYNNQGTFCTNELYKLIALDCLYSVIRVHNPFLFHNRIQILIKAESWTKKLPQSIYPEHSMYNVKTRESFIIEDTELYIYNSQSTNVTSLNCTRQLVVIY